MNAYLRLEFTSFSEVDNVFSVEKTRFEGDKMNKNDPETMTEEGLTERALLVLVLDISELHETVERIRVQVHTLAKRHGIELSE